MNNTKENNNIECTIVHITPFTGGSKRIIHEQNQYIRNQSAYATQRLQSFDSECINTTVMVGLRAYLHS